MKFKHLTKNILILKFVFFAVIFFIFILTKDTDAPVNVILYDL